MEETDEVPPIGITRRRVSQASRRRPSGASIHQSQRASSSAGHSTPPRSASPHKSEFSEPGPSTSPQSQTRAQPPAQHIPLPRARLNSIVTRGLDVAQAAASPLAQIFQPLIVDDDLIPEEQAQIPVDGSSAQPGHAEGNGGAPAPSPGGALVSYGPATRRRLMSMHAAPSPPRRMRTFSVAAHGPHAHRPDTYGATGESSTALRRFPTNSPQPRSHLGLYSAAPLSTSPGDARSPISEQQEQDERGRSPGPHETAAQVESEGNPEASEWERRLVSIEDRQKRIEDMLVEISRNLRQGSDR